MRKLLHRASQLLTAAIVIFEFLFMCWLQTDISNPTPIGACPFYAFMIGHILFLCVAGMTAIDGEYVKKKTISARSAFRSSDFYCCQHFGN